MFHIEKEFVSINNIEYEVDISLLQVEITTKCNYSCRHCREGNGSSGMNISLEYIKKTIDFILKFNSNFSQVTLSGGEPLLSEAFFEILEILNSKKIKTVCITTNGSFLNENILKRIKKYNFNKVIFSISMEYLEPERFNEFRGSFKAYENVIKALSLISNQNSSKLESSLRVSVSKELCSLEELEKFVKFSINHSCNKIKITPILPVGRAKNNNCYIDTSKDMKKLKKSFLFLQNKYKSRITLETNDPLISFKKLNSQQYIISGCGAGITSLNLMSNGDLTPCSLLPNVIICNVGKLSVDNIIKKYKESQLIKN